jgi:hypothetical protein
MRGFQRTQMRDIDTSKIIYDTQFTGGAIEIGEREVKALEQLERDLSVICQPIKETMQDTADALLHLEQHI